MEHTRIYSLDNSQLEQELAQSVIRCTEHVHSIVDRESSWKIQFLAAQLIVQVPKHIPENGHVLNSIIEFLDNLSHNIEQKSLSEFPYCPELFEQIFKDLLASTVHKITRRKIFELYHAVMNPLSKLETSPDFAHTALKKYAYDPRQMEFFS